MISRIVIHGLFFSHLYALVMAQSQITSSGRKLGFDDTLRLVDTIRSTAQSFGVNIHPTSRIWLFEEKLRRLGSIKLGELANSAFDWNGFTEGNRDAVEIAFICQSLREKFPNELLQWLPTVLSGSHLPLEADTKARDKQFELYIAALFANSGFPVSLCEPDVRFEHEGKTYGIAAKRVSSKRKIEKRVREGIKQLEKSGLRGLLTISADRLLSMPIPRVVAANEEALDQAGTDLVEEFLKQYSKKIALHIRSHAILGVAVNLVVPAFMHGQLGDIGTTTTLRFLQRPDGSNESIEFLQSINTRIKPPC